MKVWEIRTAGGIDALAIAEREAPEPAGRQVLVRMRAVSLNYRDLAMVRDPVGRNLQLPRIPNSDGAGEVLAVGDQVSRFKTGDRVAGTFFQRWVGGPITADVMASALGGALDGVLAEHALLDEDGLVAIPGHLSFDEAATLPCAALTAWNCLVETGGMRAGDTVLLLGTGGVSIFGLQLARMFGARAIITSSSDKKLSQASEMGAWKTVNYRQTPDWDRAVMELTDGRGADIVLEVGGAGTLQKSVEAVKIGGTVSLVGVLTGGTIDPVPVMRKSVRLQGIYVGSRTMFENMNRALAAHELHPVIDKRFAFEDTRVAFHHMAAAGHFGKIVVTV